MASPFKTLLITAGIALGVASMSPVAAEAGNRASVIVDNGGITLQVRSLKHKERYVEERRYRNDRRHYRDGQRSDRGFRNRGDRRSQRHATCSPERALRKVERRGLRRAFVRRVDGRGVVIAGRKRGERVVVGFGRHPSCPVRFVRSRGW